MAAKKKAGSKAGTQLAPKPHNDPSQYAENRITRRFFDSINVEALHTYMLEPQYKDPNTNESKYIDYLRSFDDPAFNKLGDWSRLHKFGITIAELHQIYIDGQRHLGLLQMANRLPKVIDDTAEDAESRLVNCPRCDGEKEVGVKRGKETVMKTCPECKGIGEVKVSGDKHARDLVFESAKLIKQGGGPLVAIQQNINNDNGGSRLDASLENLMKLTQSITIGSKGEGK